MKAQDVIELQEPKLNSLESMFVPAVLVGLGTTIRHLGQTLRGVHRTLQYPEERRENKDLFNGGMDIQRYRGVHRLNRDEQGRVKCVACFMFATACPAHCIHIVGEQAPWTDREKYPAKFDIDELRCIYCAQKKSATSPAPPSPSNSPATSPPCCGASPSKPPGARREKSSKRSPR